MEGNHRQNYYLKFSVQLLDFVVQLVLCDIKEWNFVIKNLNFDIRNPHLHLCILSLSIPL
jgi:hypothetical protein